MFFVAVTLMVARTTTTTGFTPMKADAVVAGGGPGGIAAGIELASLGYRTVVLEKRETMDEFEKAKAFNYLIDIRGQRWTDRHAVTDHLREKGVSSDNYTITRIFPDKTSQTVVPPLSAPKGIWIPRAQFLTEIALKARTFPNLELRCGMTVENINMKEDQCIIHCVDTEGNRTTYENPRILIGSDGINSVAREALGAGIHQLESPSTGLLYKILTVSSTFPVNLRTTNDTEETTATIPNRAYTVTSLKKKQTEYIRLGFLPVRPEVPQRTANIIRPAKHSIWHLREKKSIQSFFATSFPQLTPETFSDAELAYFTTARPGVFPKCQFSDIAAKTTGSTACFLLGDALHAFPPDLGQGLNAALEDVLVLGDLLPPCNKDLSLPRNNNLFDTAVSQYQANRVPASEALANIVRVGFPFQYGQAPKRAVLFFLGFFLRLVLSKLPFFAPPVAIGVIQGRPYTDVWRDALRTTRRLKLLAFLTALLALLPFLRRPLLLL